MAHKKFALGILFLLGLSLLEGLYARPTHASHSEIHQEKDVDWVDELAVAVGPTKQWQARAACDIMQKYIKDDEAAIKKLSAQIEHASSGVGGTVSAGIDKVTLTGAKARLTYHKKMLKALEQLSANKKDRERVVKHLSALYNSNEHLQQLQKTYDSAQGAEKASAWATLNLQKLKVKGKKAYISALLLKEGLEA
jgi:hypothetical protein